MKVLNFSHPITDRQIEQLSEYQSADVEVIDIPVKLDLSQDIVAQIRGIVDAATERHNIDWQSDYSQVVNLPGHSVAASVLLAELHGRKGHFPAIMQLNREDDGSFAVKEIIQLQNVRDSARWSR